MVERTREYPLATRARDTAPWPPDAKTAIVQIRVKAMMHRKGGAMRHSALPASVKTVSLLRR